MIELFLLNSDFPCFQPLFPLFLMSTWLFSPDLFKTSHQSFMGTFSYSITVCLEVSNLLRVLCITMLLFQNVEIEGISRNLLITGRCCWQEVSCFLTWQLFLGSSKWTQQEPGLGARVENKCLSEDAMGSSSLLSAGPACMPFKICTCAIFGSGAINF